MEQGHSYGRAYALPISATKVTPTTVDPEHSGNPLINMNDCVMCSEQYYIYI